MGRVFIEETLNHTGINRNNLVVICTYLVRSGQAKTAADAIRKLEEGDFDGVNLEEEMIQAHRKVPEQTFEDTTEDIDAI
tara:strand:- start:44 stop:283 length:240 start_codon:yes stop_codon:yes gene_type:complete